jgi:hypothetical protein
MKTKSCAVVDGDAVGSEPFEDLLGGLGPHERAPVLVPDGGPLQMSAASSLSLRCAKRLSFLVVSGGKPPFDEVHPRPVRGSEVEGKPAIAQQPVVDRRVWWDPSVSRINCTSKSAETWSLTLSALV